MTYTKKEIDGKLLHIWIALLAGLIIGAIGCTLTYPYVDDAIGSYPEQESSIYYWDAEKQEWVKYDTTWNKIIYIGDVKMEKVKRKK